MTTPILSICIPTYNRARFLDECLGSLCLASAEVWREVEVVISDNASTDATPQVVEKYGAQLPIRYFRNPENIGGERNFVAVAQRANAEHVWIFGDDDVFEPTAIAAALEGVKQGFDMIVLNYSLWSLDMGTKRRAAALPFRNEMVFRDPNAILATLGNALGYISCVVIRSRILISVPAEEYEPFVQYGFSHLYSNYVGLLAGCKVIYYPHPVFKNREDNCQIFLGPNGFQEWTKYFIYGSAIVFNALEEKGYTRISVISAKGQVLRDFLYKAIFRGLPGVDRKAVLSKMIRLYKWNWRFWLICAPGLLLPRPVLRFARDSFLTARGWIG